jgi:hypothetical protein
MDGSHFDSLVKDLTTHGSRRRALGGLLAGVVSFLNWPGQENAEAHDLKDKCKKKSGEAKKKCLKKAKKHKAEHAGAAAGCTRNCTGKSCGDDGCGGSCGSCAVCRQCSGGACIASPDFTACGGGKQCSGGVCATPPDCQNGAACIHGNSCCSGTCLCDEYTAEGYCYPTSDIGVCRFSRDGEKCSGDGDCSNRNCVGFVCQTA